MEHNCLQHCWTTATDTICLTIPAKNTTASFLKSRKQEATIRQQMFNTVTSAVTENSFESSFKCCSSYFIGTLWQRYVLETICVKLDRLVMYLMQQLIEIFVSIS